MRFSICLDITACEIPFTAHVPLTPNFRPIPIALPNIDIPLTAPAAGIINDRVEATDLKLVIHHDQSVGSKAAASGSLNTGVASSVQVLMLLPKSLI